MIPYYRLREAIVQAKERPDDLAGAAITPEKRNEIRESKRFKICWTRFAPKRLQRPASRFRY